MLTRKFGWDEQRTAQALNVLGNSAIVVEPPRLTEVIEGSHADNWVLECAGSHSRRLPGDRRPEASTALRGTPGNDDCQRSPVSVNAGAGPIGGGYLARPDH